MIVSYVNLSVSLYHQEELPEEIANKIEDILRRELDIKVDSDLEVDLTEWAGTL